MNLTLRPVRKKDYKFLYELLKQRPQEENISHKVMPSYKEHCVFNSRNPYKADRIIEEDGKPVGRVYFTDRNEIGIHFLRGKEGLINRMSFTPCFFNVSPRNKWLNKYLKKKGAKLIQYTYAYIY